MTPVIVQLVNTEVSGIVVSEHLLAVPDSSNPTGLKYQAMLGICWENNRCPAISYHSPEEVEWLAIPELENNDDDDENEEDDDDENEEQQELLHQTQL